MEKLLTVVVPVFAIVLAGAAAGRLRVLGADSSKALNGFVFHFALPPLLFISLTRVEPDEIINVEFIAAFLGGQAAAFVLGLVLALLAFRRPLDEASLHAMAAGYPNTGHMGIPLTIVAFGEAGLLPAVIATVITSAVVVGVVMALIELAQSRAGSALGVARDVGKGLVRNPLLMAPLAGLAVSFAGIPVPKVVDSFCSLIGQAAGPCALFSLGLFLAAGEAKASRAPAEIASMAVIKMAVQPLVTFWLATKVFAMPALWSSVAVLMAALPAGVGLFIVAQKYDTYVARSSSAILVSTLLSVLSLSVLLPWLLERAGL